MTEVAVSPLEIFVDEILTAMVTLLSLLTPWIFVIVSSQSRKLYYNCRYVKFNVKL